MSITINHVPFSPPSPPTKPAPVPLSASNSFEDLCANNLAWGRKYSQKKPSINTVNFQIEPSQGQQKDELLAKKMKDVSLKISAMTALYTGSMILTFFPEKNSFLSKEYQELITSVFIGSMTALLGGFSIFYLQNR